MIFELCIRFFSIIVWEKIWILYDYYIYRSALSAYHEQVDKRLVGKHPKVCNLMIGLFNRNPPKPRYVIICAELSYRHINFKLAILLFLTSAGWYHEIVMLKLNLWLEHQVLSSFFIFSSFLKLQKSGGKGNLHHVRSFMKMLIIKNFVKWLVLTNT